LGLAPLCAAQEPAPESPPTRPAPAAPKKRKSSAPSASALAKLLDEQKALIAEQAKLIEEQQATIAEQQGKLEAQDVAIEEQRNQLAALEEQLAAVSRRLEEIEQQIPAAKDQQALEERLKRIEEAAAKVPELPPTVVSAGNFPGSIRIPGTDAAVKF